MKRESRYRKTELLVELLVETCVDAGGRIDRATCPEDEDEAKTDIIRAKYELLEHLKPKPRKAKRR